MIRQWSCALWQKTGPICWLLVGLTAGRKAGRQNSCFFKFYNITCNESILALNGHIAVITYCTNPVLLQIFASNNIVKAAVNLLHFREAIYFLVNSYYQVLAYLMIDYLMTDSKMLKLSYLSNVLNSWMARFTLFIEPPTKPHTLH